MTTTDDTVLNINRRLMLLEASEAKQKEDIAVIKEDISIIKQVVFVIVTVSSTTLVGLLLKVLLKV